MPTWMAVEYDVGQTITLVNEGPGIATRVLLWVALSRDVEPYQRVLSMEVRPDFETITDEYGNLYARFEFDDVDSGEEVVVEARYRVAVRELDFDLGECEGQMPSTFVEPEPFIESDAEEVVALAEMLGDGKTTACEKVEAFYDYVGDSVSYSGYNPGDKGALSTLRELTGDCTEFADLAIALSRAADVPARFVEGVTCCTNGDYVEGEIKHSWLEVYLPGIGWAPMDPTYGRFPSDREAYFAATTPDRIVVTQGRNPSLLDGYHYYRYRYWRGDEPAAVSTQEEWWVVRWEE
jgi:transglutaminase-like putative cysteine protease